MATSWVADKVVRARISMSTRDAHGSDVGKWQRKQHAGDAEHAGENPTAPVAIAMYQAATRKLLDE